MTRHQHVYRVLSAPNAADPRHQAIAGDVRAALSALWEQTLVTLAGLSPDEVVLRFVLKIEPEQPHATDPRHRLTMFVGVDASNEQQLRLADGVLLPASLRHFYPLQRVGARRPWPRRWAAGCQILRSESALEPLVGAEDNDRALPCYYLPDVLKPESFGDGNALDALLDGIQTPVLIELALTPTHAAGEQQQLNRYLGRLHAINHGEEADLDVDVNLGFDLGDGGGVIAKGVGGRRCRDRLADDVHRQVSRVAEELRGPQLEFAFRVLSDDPAAAQVVAAHLAQAAFADGTARAVALAGGQLAQYTGQPNRRPAVGCGMSAAAERFFAPLRRIAQLASPAALVGATLWPIGVGRPLLCFPLDTDPVPLDSESTVVMGRSEAGAGYGPLAGVSLDNLPKHLFISGVPGSGKSTALIQILLETKRDGRDIPTLVLELRKTEVRGLKQHVDHDDPTLARLARCLRIFTPGNDAVSPYQCNPLEIIGDLTADEHIEYVLSCFEAGMSLPGPLRPVLREALNRLYEASEGEHRVPTLRTLPDYVNKVLAEKGYSGDIRSDLQAAADVRLGDLTRGLAGRVFNTDASSPGIDHLMTQTTVIEMDRLAVPAACFQTLVVLMQIQAWLQSDAAPPCAGAVRLVLIIDEAHILFGERGGGREDAPDPSAAVTQVITRMLAELRARGVAIVLSDQLPSAIPGQVIKLTSAKLAFRQVAHEDRQHLGATMLLRTNQIEHMARLQPGQAFFYREGLFMPELIRTFNLHEQLQLGGPLSNRDLRRQNECEPWFIELNGRRIGSMLAQLDRLIDAFDRQRAGQLRRLQAIVTASRGESPDWAGLARRAGEHQQAMAGSLAGVRKAAERLLPARDALTWAPDPVRIRRDRLARRLEHSVVPETRQCLAHLQKMIDRYQNHVNAMKGA